MSPAVSVAKAKPAVWVVDAGDIGTAADDVPVFLRPLELGGNPCRARIMSYIYEDR